MTDGAPGARRSRWSTLSRRQRLLRLTVAFGAGFLLIAALVAWAVLGRGDAYRPGDPVPGLTAELARALPPDYPRVTFTDVTAAAGIAWRHFSGVRTSQLPEDMGSGAAWSDFDGDGWVDLALANEVGPLTLDAAGRRASPAHAALYRNNGDGTFSDVTAHAGIMFDGWGMAAAFADYDNDGDPDLLFTAYGHNVLYRNNGDGMFTDRSAASGIGAPEGFWTGAAWGDYDRDGRLDLYVTGYVVYTTRLAAGTPGLTDVENPASINPSSFKPERNLLFHNRGDGTFEEVAARAGVTEARGRGLVAAWLDVDADGWPDLFVGNDVSDNVLFRNRGDGTFADISLAARLADYRSTMGIAVGDWNGDGAFDLYLTHWLAQGNALYDRVVGTGTFMDESDRFGLGQISLDFVGWGTSFFDYDNDGGLDLMVINGSTLQLRSDPTRLVPMRPQLFWNRGAQEGFFEVSRVSGPFFDSTYVGRGLALADYDNDGDVDALVTTNGGRAYLLRNDGGNGRHWLQVEVRGAQSNPFGVGTRLRMVAGGRSQARWVGAQASYLSQNSLIETFGLGTVAGADTLEIVWPDGARETLTHLAGGRRYRVTQGASAVADDVGQTPTAAEREQVLRFWSFMRTATAQRTAGRTREAAGAYDSALAINPRHEDALYYAGSMRLALGENARAMDALRRLVEVNPESARGHSRLGGLYACLAAGAPYDLDSAEAHFRRAHQINREETGPLLRLGEVALLRHDDDRARRMFETVLATHAASAPARFYLGFLAWRLGDTASAGRQYRASVTLPVAAATAAPAGVTNEGDTRGGGPMTDVAPRCDMLRAISEERGSGAGPDAMNRRYRRLAVALSVSARPR